MRNKYIRIAQIALIGILGLFLCYPVGYFVLKENQSWNVNLSAHKSDDFEGVGVYLINLDRSKERYQYVRKFIDGLGMEVNRISAVDGKTLKNEYIKQVLDVNKYEQYLGSAPKLGTIGCSLSHIKTWETFLNSNFEFALIFEDDIAFDPKELKATIDDLLNNKELWDINLFEIHHSGMPLSIKKLSNDRDLSIYLVKISHSGAYIINRKAAKNLLKNAIPIVMPVDHYFTRNWELDLKFTGIEPRIVHQSFGDSDISKTDKIEEESVGVVRGIKRAMY